MLKEGGRRERERKWPTLVRRFAWHDFLTPSACRYLFNSSSYLAVFTLAKFPFDTHAFLRIIQTYRAELAPEELIEWRNGENRTGENKMSERTDWFDSESNCQARYGQCWGKCWQMKSVREERGKMTWERIFKKMSSNSQSLTFDAKLLMEGRVVGCVFFFFSG